MQLKFFPFEPADLPSYLEIYDSVEKDYFTPANRAEFVDYLTRFTDPYYLARLDGAPAACGGFYLKTPRLAVLTWGIVHSRFQRKGLGAQLLLFRLTAARELGAEQVEIHTSQLTEGFFEKFGFVRTRLVENGFGEGIHEVDMLKTML